MSLVLDNSVTMRWCFGDGLPADLDYAANVARHLRDETAVVPALWALEVANVISRAERQALLTPAHSRQFLQTLTAMRIEADPATARHGLDDTLQLARQHGLSAYDAAYLELALRRALPLATLDTQLRSACKATGGQLFGN